jgi:hypothetical protein
MVKVCRSRWPIFWINEKWNSIENYLILLPQKPLKTYEYTWYINRHTTYQVVRSKSGIWKQLIIRNELLNLTVRSTNHFLNTIIYSRFQVFKYCLVVLVHEYVECVPWNKFINIRADMLGSCQRLLLKTSLYANIKIKEVILTTASIWAMDIQGPFNKYRNWFAVSSTERRMGVRPVAQWSKIPKS